MGVLEQHRHNLIEVVVLLVRVQGVQLVGFNQTLELNAPVKLTLVLKAPVTNHIERLREIFFPVLQECFAGLDIKLAFVRLTWCFLFG
jgi:hypothetical protein